MQPVRENIHQIGKALAEIFEIEAALHAAHPHLRPAYLDEPDPHATSNRPMTVAMVEACDHENRRNLVQAIATYRALLELEQSALHRDIAENEIERLKRKMND